MKKESEQIVYELYLLHEDQTKSVDEKILDVKKKYSKLGYHWDDWEAIRFFFENPVYVRFSYECETYQVNCKANRRCSRRLIIEDRFSHIEAVKGNVYIYSLLLTLREPLEIITDVYGYGTDNGLSRLCRVGKRLGLKLEMDSPNYTQRFACIHKEEVVGEIGEGENKCIIRYDEFPIYKRILLPL